MDHEKKLLFLQNMAHMALSHAATTPNMPTSDGKMSHEKMMEFVNKTAKMGLQHLDSGGFAGGISSALGTNNNFQAQKPIINPGTNSAQIETAYNKVDNALNQQQGLVNNVNPGISQGVGSQNTLTDLYTNQAKGIGPNPALAQLNQTTGQNIAQQAALAAGQRGAGANAGLIATQNAQQGAATQQQAVGQAATLGAQQQLAAENNLQNLAATQVNQGTGAIQGLNNAQQNEQNILQGANTAANNANVAATSNINNVNAGISEGNQQTNSNILSGVLGAAGSLPGIGGLFAHGGMVKMDKGGNVLDANARKHIAPHNFALAGGRYPIHDISHARNALARVSQNGTPEEKAKVKAAVHKKYPSLAGKKMAAGGEVVAEEKQIEHKPWVAAPRMMADGGVVGQQTNAPQSFVGNWLNSSAQPGSMPAVEATHLSNQGGNPLGFLPGAAKGMTSSSPTDGGEFNAKDYGGSHAEDYKNIGSGSTAFDYKSLPDVLPVEAAGLAKGGLMKGGGKVAASGDEKAVKDGDSLDNDKVPAMLSEGEIVIPRHITMGANAPAKAAAFVAKELAKRGRK